MITREEYELLKQYRAKGYGWIARSKNGELCAFKVMPVKFYPFWRAENGFHLPCIIGECGDNILTCVTWKDEEPTKINDLIRDYDSHLVITGGDSVNKAELIKEIEDILDDIAVREYQLGEYAKDNSWSIPSSTIRKIFSAIEKYSPDEKVVIPQFVADWIENRKPLYTLASLFNSQSIPEDVHKWIARNGEHCDKMARAWLDGYEIENEKLYTVRLANGSILIKDPEFNTFQLCKAPKEQIEGYEYKLTQSEIESVDPRLMQFAEEVE